MSVLDGHIKPDEFRMILGKKLRYPIDEGKPIFWSHIDMPYRPRGGLAPTINRGMRAVSISVGGEAGVSGLVKPSDRVDMLGTFSFPSKTVPGDWELVTLTILQNVTVLATGQELARGAGAGRDQYRRASRGYSSVTVELTPEEAELIVFASRMKGSLTLTLRNPTDVSHIQPENLKSVDFNHLEKKIPEYHTERRNRQLSPRRRSP